MNIGEIGNKSKKSLINYSVIVPYRDKYDLFLKAINSIPDRDDIQIIIVDNAPQPLSASQVPQKLNANVVYSTSSPTKGAGCARNEGLKHVEGEFLLFLDADDFFTDEAFAAFDRYLNEEYDIVFFKPTSVRLKDGETSDRHLQCSNSIDQYLKNGNDGLLRYRWEVPWSKLFRTEFVKKERVQFDEIKVNNDAWFSIMTGHAAKKVHADSSVVYAVTEGESGSSLTKKRTKENWFIRYQVAIRINKFLKSEGKYQYRIRLLGFLKVVLKEFGIIEFCYFFKYAIKNKVGIF